MYTRRDVFHAIADPTRRSIIDLIAQESMNLNAIAENFEMSRPAVSQHIKVLVECGLVEIRQEGRERFCHARLEKLETVSTWVEQYKKDWRNKFKALENHLSNLKSKKVSK